MAVSILYPYTKSNKTTIRTNFGFWCLLTFLTIFIVFGQTCSNFLPLRATQDSK